MCDLFEIGMVHRSKRFVQRNLGFQHVFGAALSVSFLVHDIAVYVVHRAIFLSHRFRHGPGTNRNRRVHDHQHHWSYKHCRNGIQLRINVYRTTAISFQRLK